MTARIVCAGCGLQLAPSRSPSGGLMGWCPKCQRTTDPAERLRELEAQFAAQGGRGVELADEIDALRAAVAS